MKVKVDFEMCESNALCMDQAPTVFEVRDDDFLYLLKEEIDDEEEDAVREAIRRCPRQAISLEE